MNIGDYVRVEIGSLSIQRICKIIKIIYDDLLYTNIGYFVKEDIIKSSPNIIDLIEVGDYVNGHKVVEVDLDDIDDYGNDFRYIETEYDFTLNHWVKENEIETILTKEQFKSMEYKVGGKE